MTPKQKINQDFKEAMKAKEAERLSALRMLQAAIKNKEVEKRTKLSKKGEEKDLEKKSQLTDEEIIEVVFSEIKKRKDAAEQYQQGSRNELAKKEEAEAKILQAYLPEQLSEDKVRELAKKAIAKAKAAGPKDMGKVMGALMPEVKGKADGAMVSRIVKEELAG